MQFRPRTEKELAESRLMAKGVYDFEIVDALERTSKSSGKPMIELKVKVTRPDGTARFITDYLLEQRAEKLRHAAAACGVLDRYEEGSLSNSDFHQKRGKLKLGVEKDKTRTYPDKNVVIDYLPPAGSAVDYSSFTK
jgi:hypothetical protein